MKKLFVLVLLLLTLNLIGPCLPVKQLSPVQLKTELSQQDVIAATMSSVVYIKAKVDSEFDDGWSGSGVYVGNGLVMTARHVIEGASEFTITFENEEEWISDYAITEKESDVGFIYINPMPECVSLEFNSQDSKRGDVVYILGNPFGLDFKFSVTKGIVSAIGREHENFFGNKLVFQVDAAAYPGNSGGPVVNEQGEIVGILVGGIGAENISLCIPVKICEQALKTALEVLKMKALE